MPAAVPAAAVVPETPSHALVRQLHATCDAQVAQLLDANTTFANKARTHVGDLSLAYVNFFKMKALAQEISLYKSRLPPVDPSIREADLRVQPGVLSSGPELIHIEATDLKQARVMCERFSIRVQECLLDTMQR